MAFLSLREFCQNYPFRDVTKLRNGRLLMVRSQTGLNRIFANKGNCRKKIWGTSLLPQVALISLLKPIWRVSL